MNPTSQVIKQNTRLYPFPRFSARLLVFGSACSPECCSHLELRWTVSNPAPAVQVSPSPQTAQVVLRGQVQFTATVSWEQFGCFVVGEWGCGRELRGGDD